jgi:hypothetical protein
MTGSLSSSLFRKSPDGTTQLPLFASPNELSANYDLSSNDASNFASYRDMMASKYEDSDPSFRASIAEKGIQAPIAYEPKVDEQGNVQGINIVNGNHRLAVAATEAPDAYLPLEAHEYPAESHQKDAAANKAGFPDSHGEFWTS